MAILKRVSYEETWPVVAPVSKKDGKKPRQAFTNGILIKKNIFYTSISHNFPLFNFKSCTLVEKNKE